MTSRAKKPMDAVGYVGATRARKKKRGASATAPDARIKAYAQKRGWNLVAVHTQSPASEEPVARQHVPQAALEDACRRRAVLVVRSLAELAGSVAACLQISAQLHRAGAHLAVIDEQIDTTLDDGFVFGLMAALGKLKGPQRIAEPRFGFTLADDGASVVVNPREQEVIRQMVAWRREGLSHQDIVKRLQSRKITGPAGGRWRESAVRAILALAPTSRWDGL
jgi:DNA invertase Pin-like site-specific DNA recombinase